MCNCNHCRVKHMHFQSEVLKHNGLPIMSMSVRRSGALRLAIEHIESRIEYCDLATRGTLEIQLVKLKDELHRLTH